MNVESSTSKTGVAQVKNSKYDLKAEDFINMMLTQLQNQDPMEPAKNGELLTQMSQIGQLQSSTTLQASLKTMVSQNNIASAGAMIGKHVTGKDGNGADMNGIVTSVAVENGDVYLNLDSGKKMSMGDVTGITTHAA